MAITNPQKEKFIELRAEGRSFDTISKEMIEKCFYCQLKYILVS